MKIVTVVGARPQFIKAAVVSRALKQRSGIAEVIVHTGQHFDANMSEVFFKELSIPDPQYNLDVNNMPASLMTGTMIGKIHEVLQIEKPNLVLVYGDTNSTLAGAIAAKQNHIPLAHVEAGARSFNMMMPEEFNRVITDRISDYLFCPTEISMENLRNEGFGNYDCKMIMSGDVMYDAALFYKSFAESKTEILKINNKKDFILATIHRAENVDDIEKLSALVSALNEINEQIPVVLPLHPRTKNKLAADGLKLSFETINPVGYLDMIQLLNHCKMVITDSGGLQKESFFFHKLCITLREETEWPELVHHGFNILTGTDKNRIMEAFEIMMNRKIEFNIQFFGDGHAGEKIVDYLLTEVKSGEIN